MFSRHARRSPRNDPFSRIRADLERWRRRRVRGDRIPERLWAAAVDLAREHGVSQTSIALRLDYYSLKDRLEASKRSPTVTRSRLATERRRPRTGFVEIPLEIGNPPAAAAPGSTPSADCVLLLENARGTRLRVELRGPAATGAQVDSLARSLWRGVDREERSRP
jgi:hypothetical protein